MTVTAQIPLRQNPSPPREITALWIGRVGDLIVGTAFLRALRRGFPRARIRLVTSALGAEAAGLIPFVDETLAVHKLGRPLENLRAAGRLLGARCDLLIDLNPSFSRTAAALAALIRAPAKLSFRRGRLDRLFTLHARSPGEAEPMLERYARLAAVLGLEYEPVTELKLGAEDERKGEELMKRLDPEPDDGLRVVIHPGNFKKFENRWPEEKFAALSARLLDIPRLRLFYLAGPGEEGHVRGILSRLEAPVPMIPPCALGVTGAIMRRMSLCVLNITGTTHLAAALGVPTFGFYSGYTHAVWKPPGPRHSGVVSGSWESCRDIPVEEAWSALRKTLGIC